MGRIELYTRAEAADFFERWGTYSAEYVRVAIPRIHQFWPSRNHYEEWRNDAPIGATLHYTAGVDYAGTIRHFVLEHRASANAVVGRGLDPRFTDLRKQLELDADLRAEAVQIVGPSKPAWHAAWVNRFLYGIESRNAGILRALPKTTKANPLIGDPPRAEFFKYGNVDVDELDFYWWADGWTAPFRGEVTNVRGSWWESWSRGTVATVITILRYLNALYPGSLRPQWLVAHHHLTDRKNDCVLLPNLGGIRDAVFSRTHVDDIQWLAELDDIDDHYQDSDDPWMLRDVGTRQGDRAEEDLEDFHPDVPAGTDIPAEATDLLGRFGYYVGTASARWESLRTFQRGRLLDVTGKYDRRTATVLERELRSWRLI